MLESHCKNFETLTGIPTRFSVLGGEKQLPVQVEQRAFSIAHNALSNSYRHAAASQVEVVLEFQDRAVRMAVQDDGRGMDLASNPAAQGHGLRNMQIAAEELGGCLELTSRPNGGTLVVATVPLEHTS